MPVIVNCTIYDDVMEYNFGKTRTYKACTCTKNIIRRFDKVVEEEINRRKVYDGTNYRGGLKTNRTKNSFVLTY